MESLGTGFNEAMELLQVELTVEGMLVVFCNTVVGLGREGWAELMSFFVK